MHLREQIPRILATNSSSCAPMVPHRSSSQRGLSSSQHVTLQYGWSSRSAGYFSNERRRGGHKWVLVLVLTSERGKHGQHTPAFCSEYRGFGRGEEQSDETCTWTEFSRRRLATAQILFIMNR
jgi:hypothetical protein